MKPPILYSFRRCPYAIRARMALRVSRTPTELREVVLRDKPASMLAASSKGTVPVLILGTRVLDESLDIMLWALRRNDPEGWLQPPHEQMLALITRNDTDFKHHLDRYKYASRYDDVNPMAHRRSACLFLGELEEQLTHTHLFGADFSLADAAIAPFVRQFSNVDPPWFATAPYPHVRAWLASILASERFTDVMIKVRQWKPGDS